MPISHTPGSWEPIIIKCADGTPTYGVKSLKSGACVAWVSMPNDANAIAAWPELLAALQALTEWGCTHTSPQDANSPHALLIAARAAIAKAVQS
jgi:hypothetical protein